MQTPFLSVAAGVATAAITAAGNLIENHDVSLTTVCAVGATVCVGVWRLSAIYKGISIRLEEGEKRFNGMEQKIDNLKTQIESLDCHNNGCAEPKPKKPYKQ